MGKINGWPLKQLFHSVELSNPNSNRKEKSHYEVGKEDHLFSDTGFKGPFHEIFYNGLKQKGNYFRINLANGCTK